MKSLLREDRKAKTKRKDEIKRVEKRMAYRM